MSLKITIKQNIIEIIMLTLLFFSNAVFRTGDKVLFMALILACASLFAGLKMLCFKRELVNRLICSKFNLWFSLLFLMYFFYGNHYNKAIYYEDYFSNQYFLYMFFVVFVTRILLLNLSKDKIIDVYFSASTLASLAVCVYVVSIGNGEIFSGSRMGEEGLFSGNSNTVGMNIGLLAAPLFFKFLNQNKLSFLVPCVLIGLVMMLSGSKKAIMILLVFVALYGFLFSKKSFGKTISTLIIAVTVLGLIFTNEYLYDLIGFRIVDFLGTLGMNISGYHDSNSTNLRLMMYKLAFDAFCLNPIFGGGWFYFGEYSGLGTYSHNNFMELLVTFGVFGFALYYYMTFFLIIKFAKLSNFDINTKFFMGIFVLSLFIDSAAVNFSMFIIYYQIVCIAYTYNEKFSLNSKYDKQIGVYQNGHK